MFKEILMLLALLRFNPVKGNVYVFEHLYIGLISYLLVRLFQWFALSVCRENNEYWVVLPLEFMVYYFYRQQTIL